MKRLSQQETLEAFGDFAQKAERMVKPKITKAKGCLSCLIGLFVGFVGLMLILLQSETMGKVIGLGILVFGLNIAASKFLPYKAEKIATGLLFVVFGAAFAFFGYRSYQLGTQSKAWPVAKGAVIQSEVVKSTRTTGTGTNRRKVVEHVPIVAYAYNVDRQSYRSSRITFGASNKLNARKTVARYPKGKQIKVFYNPQKPDQAVLEPGADSTLSIVFIGIGVSLAFMGAFYSVYHLKRAGALSQASHVAYKDGQMS